MQAQAAVSNHSELRERVLAYLDARTVFNLATYGPAGLWASAVLYVHEGTTLYFTSVAATRHGQNMLATGVVAGTISDECFEFQQMKGLQIEGAVDHVDDEKELRRIVRAYLARFPFAAGLWHGETDPEVIARAPGIHGFYRITPTRLLFTDNEHAPGAREELPAE
ncbi:MAG TPA: pyridoxamine 5'-phosphate oxidase family protein [Kofleriaceae bacterium]